MRWLVDGYNVIRCDPGLAAHEGESLEAGRDALCRLLADAARTSGDQFTIVFDRGRRSGPITSSPGWPVQESPWSPTTASYDKRLHVLARLPCLPMNLWPESSRHPAPAGVKTTKRTSPEGRKRGIPTASQ